MYSKLSKYWLYIDLSYFWAFGQNALACRQIRPQSIDWFTSAARPDLELKNPTLLSRVEKWNFDYCQHVVIIIIGSRLELKKIIVNV